MEDRTAEGVAEMWAAVVLEEDEVADELAAEDVLLSEVRVLDNAIEEAVGEGLVELAIDPT